MLNTFHKQPSSRQTGKKHELEFPTQPTLHKLAEKKIKINPETCLESTKYLFCAQDFCKHLEEKNSQVCIYAETERGSRTPHCTQCASFVNPKRGLQGPVGPGGTWQATRLCT